MGKRVEVIEQDRGAAVTFQLGRQPRINDFGRALTRARVTDLLEGNEKVMLELLDAVVIWIGEQSMRVRGFETVAGVQYGQTWDVEIV